MATLVGVQTWLWVDDEAWQRAIDGTLWSADFSTFGADPRDLSKLLLKAGTLHRE